MFCTSISTTFVLLLSRFFSPNWSCQSPRHQRPSDLPARMRAPSIELGAPRYSHFGETLNVRWRRTLLIPEIRASSFQPPTQWPAIMAAWFHDVEAQFPFVLLGCRKTLKAAPPSTSFIRTNLQLPIEMFSPFILSDPFDVTNLLHRACEFLPTGSPYQLKKLSVLLLNPTCTAVPMLLTAVLPTMAPSKPSTAMRKRPAPVKWQDRSTG